LVTVHGYTFEGLGDVRQVMDLSDEEDSDQGSGKDDLEAWPKHSRMVRFAMKMPEGEAPWTGDHSQAGLDMAKKRALDVIDVAFWGYLLAHPQRADRSPTPPWFVDASQAVQRRPWGASLPCLNQDSLPYSFQLDRILSWEDPGICNDPFDSVACYVRPQYVFKPGCTRLFKCRGAAFCTV
jgi:hypothetical protein